MAQAQIILLERVEHLGQMGDIVSVKPGYARNFLLPQRKALRATKPNLAFFESQKKQLEAVNLKKKAEAEQVASKMKDLSVTIIRQAAEGGHLYGSVNARDVADAIEAAGVTIDRGQVRINQAYKSIGLFPVDVVLHPEVKVVVKLNIARSEEEAKVQLKTGKAAIIDHNAEEPAKAVPAKAELMEGSALAAEAEAEVQAQAEAAEKAEKAAKKASKKASKVADEAPVAEGEDAAAE